MFKLACVLACLSFGLVNSASFITPCASGDRACLKQSAQAAVPKFAQGIPELGIESLDPMHLDKIQASQAGLDMDFRDTTVTGLKGCTITVKRDKTKNKMNMEYTCDVTITGDYTLGGRLLILPIEGKGKYKIKVKQIVIKLTYDMAESSGADGQKHWHIASWKHSFNVLKNAEFRFHNLFNGNKQLSDTIHTFANTNWKDIMNEISPPVVRAIVTKIVDATEIFFSKVPVSELALD